MAGRLDGKVAVVTAAGQGIGRAIAEAFLREGATVWATDLDLAKLADLACERRQLDVLSTAAVDTFAAEVGGSDILVNCAGYVHHGTVLDCSERDWDFSFDLNVKSMHRTIKALLPGMLQKGSASIVNISSGASTIKAAPNRYVYASTKAAVIGLTKAVAIDFITKGVRCNCICPGTVQSPSLDARIETLADSSRKREDEVRRMFIERQPMGRLGTAEEIAAAALYLAGDESAFTTGTAMIVDGGWSL
ncbi:MAG TPA: SDR family oxidoreductase [Beijerinckiaceae bacterium]|nr:SDR family oxidoreductase [Beijerinckiaceae bacterium]